MFISFFDEMGSNLVRNIEKMHKNGHFFGQNVGSCTIVRCGDERNVVSLQI